MQHKWLARLTLIVLISGCGSDRDVGERYSDIRGSESLEKSPADQRQKDSEATKTNAIDADAVSADVENLLWQWFDANIASQERLAQSATGQRLSGDDVGNEIQLSKSQQLLFTEQLNLLVMIRKSRNTQVAKQYMLVHTLMTIDQAETTKSLLANGDPRLAGVSKQIKTARQLLNALGYQQQIQSKE